MAVLALAELASVACRWALGPIGQLPWVNLTRVQKGLQPFSISENNRNLQNS
jgi:hypothetical protein